MRRSGAANAPRLTGGFATLTACRLFPKGSYRTEVFWTRLRDDERLRAVAFYGGSVFTAISLVRSGASKHSPR
jgi:hypothetical protein